LLTSFASRILKWYARNARILPWRTRVDAYRTLVSEVMLQQTRVETVIPYFERWMDRFPTIRHLSAASETTVLRLWEGLGYYSRARNLHRSARFIVRDLQGRIPSDQHGLRQLPGIGAYSAAAIASIAFGHDEAALDGNVRRILARVFHVRAPTTSRVGERRLARLAAEHLPKGRAGEFNQALMDLGTKVCLPRQPRCDICPVEDLCKARRRGEQLRFPIRKRRRPVPHLIVGAVVLIRGETVLIARRESKGLLGGLWEFPKATLGRSTRQLHGMQRRLGTAIEGAYGLRIGLPEPLTVVQHTYSHFRVTVHAFRCGTRSAARRDAFTWVSIVKLGSYPMGRVDRRIAEHLQCTQPRRPRKIRATRIVS